MESKLGGIFCIFIFHALTMFVLCPSKYEKAKTTAVWSAVTLSSAAISFSLIRRFPSFEGGILTFSVAVILFAGTVFLLSSSAVDQTLFLLLTYMEAFMVSVFLSGYLARQFFEGDRNVAIVIRSILQLTIVALCFLLRGKFETLSQGITKGWWTLNLLALLLLSYLSILTLRIYASGFVNQTECISAFLLIVVLIAVYAVFFHMIHFMYNAAEKQRAELQSQFLLRQVETMQESVEDARRIRHDARHHNIQIQEYLQKKEYDALLTYLGAYEKDAEDEQSIQICDNLAANSILSAYVRKARQNGIAVHLDVTMERDAFISGMDIVAILANLMENAIYGCLKSGSAHPFIDVYIGRKVKKLVIYICNTAGEDVVFENGLPKSESGGGIGVTSILHSAAHYGGEYDFRSEGGRFICQILLGLPEPSPAIG